MMTFVSRAVQMALSLFCEAGNFNLPHKNNFQLQFSRNTIGINDPSYEKS